MLLRVGYFANTLFNVYTVNVFCVLLWTLSHHLAPGFKNGRGTGKNNSKN